MPLCVAWGAPLSFERVYSPLNPGGKNSTNHLKHIYKKSCFSRILTQAPFRFGRPLEKQGQNAYLHKTISIFEQDGLVC